LGQPVSIVIPTRNGAATIARLLDAVTQQDWLGRPEVVAIDSGSTDGTVELLRGRVDQLIEIEPDSFNHGVTRNRAIAESRGEQVILLVQDAIPASPDWLRHLVDPLRRDPSLAGTFARQLPHPDASRLTRWALSGWTGARSEPWISAIDDHQAYTAMPPMERYLSCVFDNVCSCVQRSVWQEHPFPCTPIAEDIEWAQEVLLSGYRLAYTPQATVLHSHDRSLRYELARTYQTHQRLYQLFGLRTVPSLKHLMRAWPATIKAHLSCLRNGPGPRPGPAGVLRALGLALVWPVGQYLGVRAVARSSCSQR
jgi:rhamnosyltransferase